MLGGTNIGVITTRQTRDPWSALATSQIVAHKSLAAYDINFLFPLYLYAAPEATLLSEKTKSEARANFSPEFVRTIESRLGRTFTEGHGDGSKTFGPKEVFHYIYAIFHSPTYRNRYAQFLKTSFPYIPITSDPDLFDELGELAGDLVALHLLDDNYQAASWNISQPKSRNPLNTLITRLVGKGDSEVAKGHPKYNDRNIYINPLRYFEGVPEEIWNVHVGGYQVCEKWLKDRRGRTLSDEDINHYQRVVVALNETIRLMAEIDRVIEEHGGWPLIGSQDSGGTMAFSSAPDPTPANEDNAKNENPLPFE